MTADVRRQTPPVLQHDPCSFAGRRLLDEEDSPCGECPRGSSCEQIAVCEYACVAPYVSHPGAARPANTHPQLLRPPNVAPPPSPEVTQPSPLAEPSPPVTPCQPTCSEGCPDGYSCVVDRCEAFCIAFSPSPTQPPLSPAETPERVTPLIPSPSPLEEPSPPLPSPEAAPSPPELSPT